MLSIPALMGEDELCVENPASWLLSHLFVHVIKHTLLRTISSVGGEVDGKKKGGGSLAVSSQGLLQTLQEFKLLSKENLKFPLIRIQWLKIRQKATAQ